MMFNRIRVSVGLLSNYNYIDSLIASLPGPKGWTCCGPIFEGVGGTYVLALVIIHY